MLTSGVIIDQHDDPEGIVLKSQFGEHIPDMLKASGVDPANMIDDEFALILQERDHTLRKFAMSPGEIARSAYYFMKCGGKLPEEAQKVAAANLVEALMLNGIEPPEAMVSLAGNTKEASTNVVETTGLFPTPRSQPKELPKEAGHWALVKEGQARYPIDSLDRVVDAINYFGRYEREFSPEDRQEYCTKVAARAAEIGLAVPNRMLDYASRTKSAAAIGLALFQRNEILPVDDPSRATLVGISKVAMDMEPDMLVTMLREFDKDAGLADCWDHEIPNPVLSVYKHAGVEDRLVFDEGNDRLSEKQLQSFARSGMAFRILQELMPADRVSEFLSDPVPIFESLPDPHKIQICRIASDDSYRDLPHREDRID